MIALTEGVFAEALREKVELLVVGAGVGVGFVLLVLPLLTVAHTWPAPFPLLKDPNLLTQSHLA